VLDPVTIDAGLLDLPLPEVGAAIRGRFEAPLDIATACGARLVGQTEALGLEGCRQDVQRIHAAALQLQALLDDLCRAEPRSHEPGAVDGRVKSANLAILTLLEPGQATPRPTPMPGPEQRAALLVVDDSETNRDILARFLERQGHIVETAASGRDALARLAVRRFDLALLDILMPEMNGFELVEHMKANEASSQVPVIFISALDDTNGKVQAFRAGGVDYITKPFQAEEVVARVENQLKISRLQQDLGRQNQELLRKNDELVRAHQRTDLVFSALADALPGTVLDGKYRLEEKIGSGGFGAVFRGTHLGLDLPVAIKVFRPVVGNDTADALERFRQEGIAASRIKHPNAVEILDNGISSTGIAYLVMELMHGHTLEAELKANGALSPQRTAEIVVPVCEALAEVHDAGIVHRDISPENIYLHRGRKGEVVKLLDFGLSKILETPAEQTLLTLTTTGTIAGTPAYMAPERLTSNRCDARADVYSLGVIMFRMLAGRPPFQVEEGGNYALAMLLLTSDPPSLPALNPAVPAALGDLVHRAMSKNPDQRPTARGLGELLRRAV
jgi:CheY-like chemotaxis protein